MFKAGDFVILNNRVGVVTRTGNDLGEQMEDHTEVWFGTFDKGLPEVFSIPTEYISVGPQAVKKH